MRKRQEDEPKRTQTEVVPVLLQPIGDLARVDGWQSVEIEENGQPLILLNDLASKRITVGAEYAAMGFMTASELQYSRFGVIEAFGRATEHLPNGVSFKVYDAWRPLELQLEIFNKFLEELRGAHVGLSETDLIKMCKIFVSLPSSDPEKPSPHYSGGAIDLTLVDANGEELWMGTGFDDFTERAGTRYFEDEQNVVTEQDALARDNRRILFRAMIEAGFSNYPEEWWHYDLGNQFWGQSTGNTACYGPISIK